MVGKFLSMSWFLFSELLPVGVRTALYSRVVYALWFKQQVRKTLSYKYSRSSLLLAARGATEIPYWWCKNCRESGQELWLVDVVVILFYLLFTNDRQKTKGHKRHSNVNVMNLLQKSQYSWNLLFFRKIIRVLLELFRRRTQNFTIIDQEECKIYQIYIWSPVTELIMQILIYVISMEFLSLRHQRPSWRKAPSGEKQGKTAVFSG